MKHLLFTIYDEKADVFMPPFFVPAVGLATRAFSDCINSDSHAFGKHPSDYTLFQIGEFDDSKAEITNHAKKSLGNGVEFKSKDHKSAIQDFDHGPPQSSIQSD